MNLLLDTPKLIWFLELDAYLNAIAKTQIDNPTFTYFVRMATFGNSLNPM